ncbi:alpha/beta hydrolase [Mucilaginibacter litoreus]|uniref:Alpha/beta hydrolase n=1 Tax=Mucilaginibacter litoreus TaxID=1048221 RepID=A0ABW3AUU4_9SPHI
MKKIYLILMLSCVTCSLLAQTTITVKLSPALKGPYTGRLFVYTLADTNKRFNGELNDNEAAFALNVTGWTNDKPAVIDQSAEYFNTRIDSLKEGYYRIAALLDTNTKERSTLSPGNVYARKEAILHITPGAKNHAELTIDNTIRERPFPERPDIKEIVFRSALLTAFRKENIYIKAGIILPPSYGKDSSATYPVIYIIPGWTGTHRGALAPLSQNAYGVGQGKEKIVIFLNPETQTPYGLHALVDSRVNGPWGKALVEEFIPYIQNNYHGSTKPSNTFVTGQSSGGYGAAWLMIHYPDAFGGCWATSPDPVDFSNYLGVDLYKDQNFYTDKNGKEREFFKLNGIYQTTLRKGEIKELFEGDGGQQQSFEAEFGKPDKNGRPKPLFDRKTGLIDRKVVAEWKDYDLAQYVVKNWPKLKPKLAGKLRIYAGDNDNFFLDKSVMAFDNKVKSISADIKVIIVPGADHFSVRVPALGTSMQKEMDELIR